MAVPGLDGFEVSRQLRDVGRFSPVLFLTARDQPEDRINGFVTGGDDHLTKPSSVDELVLRVAAIIRRAGNDGPSDMFVVGDLNLNPAGQEVRRAGALIDSSPTEFRLVHYLTKRLLKMLPLPIAPWTVALRQPATASRSLAIRPVTMLAHSARTRLPIALMPPQFLTATRESHSMA